jgi:predicted tellurium resistance membrane protein TerC
MNNFSDYGPYIFYVLILILGGIGVKLGIVTVTDVATLVAGLGVGHSVGTTGVVKQTISANTQALAANTQATVANTPPASRGPIA